MHVGRVGLCSYSLEVEVVWRLCGVAFSDLHTCVKLYLRATYVTTHLYIAVLFFYAVLLYCVMCITVERRLDKSLTIGQMQGKFQLVLMPTAGHAIQVMIVDCVCVGGGHKLTPLASSCVCVFDAEQRVSSSSVNNLQGV